MCQRISISKGSAAANSIVFGECTSFSILQIHPSLDLFISLPSTDVIHALAKEPTRLNTRFVAFLCLTFILLLHGSLLKWGLRLQNSLAMFKLLILSAIALCGILSLAGLAGFAVREEYEASKCTAVQSAYLSS